MSSLDLDAYLDRIAYDGARAPTLDVLRTLQLKHQEAIPFENLDPLLGRPVAIDVASLEAKLVHARRGGYCFEHNTLFGAALAALGFDAHLVGGRVYLDRPDGGAVPARTHLAVHVKIDGTGYLADVGFGAQSPTGPLRLDTEAVQDTPHQAYRIRPARGPLDHEGWSLEGRVAERWGLLYRFDLAEPPVIDRVVANHYVATHPDSIFRKLLMVARVVHDGRHTLADTRWKFHRLGGTTQTRVLTSPEALTEVLAETFGIEVPDGEGLAAWFEQLATRPAG